MLDPDAVNEGEPLLIGAGEPPAFVMLAPSVVKLLGLLGDDIPVVYPPAPLPLLPLPRELDGVLEPVDDMPPSELPATLS